MSRYKIEKKCYTIQGSAVDFEAFEQDELLLVDPTEADWSAFVDYMQEIKDDPKMASEWRVLHLLPCLAVSRGDGEWVMVYNDLTKPGPLRVLLEDEEKRADLIFSLQQELPASLIGKIDAGMNKAFPELMGGASKGEGGSQEPVNG